MFKLIKILNSGTNVPEPRRVKNGGASIVAGCALNYSAGAVVSSTATSKPDCIAMCDALAGAEAFVYDITPDMLFEVTVTADPDALAVGNALTLAIDGNGIAYGVTATTSGGVATVYDLAGATAAGDKITVKFA